MAAVGEGSTQRHSPRLSINSTTDGTDTPGLAVLLTVAQPQLHGRRLADKLGDRSVLRHEVEYLILGDAEIGVCLAVVGHGDQRLTDAAAHERPYVPGNHRRHAAHRTLHLRITQVIPRVYLLCLRLFQSGLCLHQGVVHRLHADTAYHVVLLQRLLVLIVHPRRGKPRLRTLTGGDGHLQGGTEGHLVDDEERLALTHRLALVGENPRDAPRHLRTHLHDLPSRQPGTVLTGERHVLAPHHHRLILG